MLILRSLHNNFCALLRLRNGDLYEGRGKGPKEVARFEIDRSRERDCLVPIGDGGFGFRGNTVPGEHVKQVVTVMGWNTRGAGQVD